MISTETILYICGIVTAVGAAVAVIRKAVSPIGEMKADVQEALRRTESDHRRLTALEDGQRATMGALLALMNNKIDGNGIDQMKDARDKLQNHIINN